MAEVTFDHHTDSVQLTLDDVRMLVDAAGYDIRESESALKPHSWMSLIRRSDRLPMADLAAVDGLSDAQKASALLRLLERANYAWRRL